MLVLSRKAKQSIRIGDQITVSIVRIKGNVIQLGIDAPQDVHIVRSELLERDAAEPASKDCQPSSEAEATGESPLGTFNSRRRATAGGKDGTSEETGDADLGRDERVLASIRLANFPSCPNLNVVT